MSADSHISKLRVKNMDGLASTLSLADLCIKYGNLLVQTCKSYKHADQEIRESILLIETLWLKIQRQLELLRNIWDTLDDDYQIHQNGVLQVLQGKAQAAIALVDQVVGDSKEGSTMRSMMSKKGESKRLKYAIWVKSSLKSIMLDLKEWAEVFDISWYLIIRQSSSKLDQELQPVSIAEDGPLSILKDLRDTIHENLRGQIGAGNSSVYLSEDFFEEKRAPFGHSEAEIVYEAGGDGRFLLDQESSISSLSDSCKLARILQKVDPFTFGILSCRGVLKTEGSSRRFAFSLPPNLEEPEFLRILLVFGSQCQPLDDRLEIAKQLAKSVMFVHSAGFVHKNIRPETVLILRSVYSESSFSFLVGFESFRYEEGRTELFGDDIWERNLYRHPTRQGVFPEMAYTMQHDIYSLGVCLLEIGIGESLVVFESEAGAPQASPLISSVVDFSIKDNKKRAFEIKRALVKMARDQLPPKMGRKYAETVVTCLTCLDKDDNSFGDEKEFLDENSVVVGVRFIEKILTTLLELRI